MNRLLSDEDLVDPDPDLVRPLALSIDGDHVEGTARHHVRIAQQLYTFWHTGEAAYLERAVDPAFVDNTLPPGRPQGTAGPLAASAAFRAAVPDLTCEMSDLLIVGDKLAVRLRFRGHFTGCFNTVQGSGQEIDFIAFDIQHIGGERIIEDWHLEDNLSFMSQAGLIAAPAGWLNPDECDIAPDSANPRREVSAHKSVLDGKWAPPPIMDEGADTN